ncbi:MAG TPA: Hsp70 family protein [Opitutaceae bacterium]|nr:Hsp70 family protein [Opitutaceae bacterium]
MSRSTIDYGIDLGTTNSAVAVLSGTGTEIIKNNVDSDVTPSAVYINRSGNLWVGQSARSKFADERAEDDVVLEFKRRMGTGFEYKFRASGRRLTPEDLSAEILKSLRADVSQKRGEDIFSAVVTVPAAFELHQCEATKRAAELAGLRSCVLLQEPVAAALAYGYQKFDSKAYWLVFDFGGGTFDAALIRADEAGMVVANHGGDNFLGGSDIDWAIVDLILAPRVMKEFGLSEFKRGDERFKYDFLRLKSAAETAKVEISRKQSTFLEATLRRVAGDTVTFETEVTREDIALAAQPIIAKAVSIARKVLSEKGLTPSAVEKLVFVGGPTLAPYFREAVKDALGIEFDLSVDPMTVVARGAAIFAGTQKMAPVTRTQSGLALFEIDLVHKPVGADPEPLIGGKVSAPDGTSLAGYTVEIANPLTRWRSGKVLLQENGAFQITARAQRGVQNVFEIELRTPLGTHCECSPKEFKYTVGMVVEEQPIINNMGVATADNKVGLHFAKGHGLPAKYTRSYRTSAGLRQGQSGSVIRIPIIEGNRPLADRNVLIGTLEISAAEVKRDLPAGTEIEVTLQMDASRILTVLAYVPLLDEEFPAKIELGGRHRQPNVEVLRADLEKEKARLQKLRMTALTEEAGPAIEALRAAEALPAFAEIEAKLSHNAVDFDTLLRTERELLDLKVKLDEVAGQIAWPAAVKEIEDWLNDLEEMVSRSGTPEEKTRAKTLREQVKAIVAQQNRERLKQKREEVADAYSAILYRQSSYWIEHFEGLAESRAQMKDPEAAERLIEAGRQRVKDNQLAELKEVVFKLQDLLPRNGLEDLSRGYGSSVMS